MNAILPLADAGQELFRALFEQAAAGIIIADEHLRPIDVNPSLCAMSGYSRREILAQSLADLIPARDLARTWLGLDGPAAGQCLVRQCRLRCKDGRLPVEITLQALSNDRLLCIVRDQSGRQQAEQALAHEATRRRILVEQSRDGIVVLDQDGKVYETNQRFADMLGYSIAEVNQLYVWDWDARWTAEELKEQIRRVNADGDHFETRHRRKNGEVYDVEISASGTVWAGQKLIFCVCRDISERQQAEAERERLIGELEAALAQVKRLSRLLPICASCKRIRDDQGYWQQIEAYLHDHSGAEFSHGICPECKDLLYPRDKYPYLYEEE